MHDILDITRRADTWATDGSHVDLKTASKAVSTTAAVVGRSTSTFAIKGLVTTSGHGELLGLIAALHVIKVDRPRGESNLLTDYMNGITAIERARAPEMKIAQWAYRPQSEMYTWLGMLIKGQRLNPTTVRHVKAHTDASDPDSLLNDAADAAAKRAHSSAAPSHATLPPPTGYMRAYVPYDHLRGYAPDAWQSTLDNRLADLQFQALPPAHQARLQFGRLGSNTVVRPYFYTRSPRSWCSRYSTWLELDIWRAITCSGRKGNGTRLGVHCAHISLAIIDTYTENAQTPNSIGTKRSRKRSRDSDLIDFGTCRETG